MLLPPKYLMMLCYPNEFCCPAILLRLKAWFYYIKCYPFVINICSWPDRLPYYVAHHDLRLLQTTIFLRISNILKSSRVLAQLCKWYIYLLWKRSCKCTYWSVSCRLHLDAVYCLIIAYWLSWIKIFRNIFIFQQNVIWRSQPCYSLVVTLVVSTFLKIRL